MQYGHAHCNIFKAYCDDQPNKTSKVSSDSVPVIRPRHHHCDQLPAPQDESLRHPCGAEGAASFQASKLGSSSLSVSVAAAPTNNGLRILCSTVVVLAIASSMAHFPSEVKSSFVLAYLACNMQ